jgi:hypothetical protein
LKRLRIYHGLIVEPLRRHLLFGIIFCDEYQGEVMRVFLGTFDHRLD